MNKKNTFTLIYLFGDFIVCFGVWMTFYLLRAKYVEHRTLPQYEEQILHAIIVSVYWIILFSFIGLYKDVLRKSRFDEIIKVGKITLMGALFIFFFIILDDPIPSYKSYRFSFGIYLSLQFFVPAFSRFAISSIISYLINKGKIFFPTILIGENERAKKLYDEIIQNKHSRGQKIIGYVSGPNELEKYFMNSVPKLGSLENLPDILEKNPTDDIIIATESSRHQDIISILDRVRGRTVSVQLIPDMYDVVSGFVRTHHVMGTPLIEISKDPMPTWEHTTKRILDIMISTLMLIILSPLFLLLAIFIKVTSRGPIIFKQERVGKDGNPFMIYKFRSMYVQAEKRGPRLAFDRDPRVTIAGRFLRKWRMDELPQFWNVLKGDMSLVGPRPEREFFIRQILERAPHYHILHRVKPGITSWGQVKFGYAGNVDEMVERLKYDILYIENMSLAMDFKIILYTILTVLSGKGK